ncbi:MAG: SpoIVB peptidase S55 domain-containing protein [Erysipelotrichaceae bacterium]
MKKFLLIILLLNPIYILAKDVILGGDSLGIRIDYNGVLVSSTYKYTIDNISIDPNSIIDPDDIIVKCNNNSISSIKDFNNCISTYKSSINNVPIVVKRNNKLVNLNFKYAYQQSSNSYITGLYMSDYLEGIGTLTYLDPTDLSYGALGHIASATSANLNFNTGNIFLSNVTGINRPTKNEPGEKKATIDHNSMIGNIKFNNIYGIYGHMDVLKDNKHIETANNDQIHLGRATIYSVLNDSTISEYQIEIIKLDNQSKPDLKGIKFRVTDKRLLDASGGIVQGMSGSPIIQDGLLIGAVTHVDNDDPTLAYGIYINWMLEQDKILP